MGDFGAHLSTCAGGAISRSCPCSSQSTNCRHDGISMTNSPRGSCLGAATDREREAAFGPQVRSRVLSSTAFLGRLPGVPSSRVCFVCLRIVPSLFAWSDAFLGSLPRMHASRSFLASLARVPSSRACLACLPRVPALRTCLAYLLRVPAS
jgi:hypothetical protein